MESAIVKNLFLLYNPYMGLKIAGVLACMLMRM